jgi:hypothetical protein
MIKNLLLSLVDEGETVGSYKFVAKFEYKDGGNRIVYFGDLGHKDLISYKGYKTFDKEVLEAVRVAAEGLEVETEEVLNYYMLYYSTSYLTNKRALKEKFKARFTPKALIDKDFDRFPKTVAEEPVVKRASRGRPPKVVKEELVAEGGE